MRRIVIVALSLICAFASVSHAARTAAFVGLGYGQFAEDGAPGGSVGVTVGVVHPLPQSNVAVGLEASWQGLGKDEGYATDGETTVAAKVTYSEVPITGQIYLPLAARPASTFYAGAGAGAYITRASAEVTASDNSGSFRISDSGTNTDFGFNAGLGVRLARGEGTIRGFGFDAKFHGILATDFTKMITAGGRLYF
jgi:opacity protein-like surface antigen